MNPILLKKLLLAAGIVGIIQGLLTLIGGVVAAEDKSPEDILSGLTNSKYACGFMRIKPKGSSSCSFDAADRGWFKRVYEALKDDVNTAGTNINKDELRKLVGYAAVLSYAIILGIGWIAAGTLALTSSINGKNKLALVAGIIFGVLYLLFVALFGAIWDSHLKIEEDCKPFFDRACSDVKDLLLRSSKEFLGYSICAFVLIMYCIIACFLAAFTSESQSADASASMSPVTEGSKAPLRPALNPNPDSGGSRSAATNPNPAMSAGLSANPSPSPSVSPGASTGLPNASNKPEEKAIAKVPTAGGKPDVIAVAPSQPAVSDTSRQFIEVHKYLVDEQRLNKKVDHKFALMDKDKSGSVSAGELLSYVTALLAKKKLPPPKPGSIATIVKAYDKDKSGKMEKGEFKLFLHDVYVMTRENLVRKYAKEKAHELKPTKPAVTNTTGAKELEALLKTPAKFYEQMTIIAKEVDKDKNQKLSHSEVADLCTKFCMKYKLPTLTPAEISAIMKDMERPVGEYDVEDLRLAAYAILSTLFASACYDILICTVCYLLVAWLYCEEHRPPLTSTLTSILHHDSRTRILLNLVKAYVNASLLLHNSPVYTCAFPSPIGRTHE